MSPARCEAEMRKPDGPAARTERGEPERTGPTEDRREPSGGGAEPDRRTAPARRTGPVVVLS